MGSALIHSPIAFSRLSETTETEVSLSTILYTTTVCTTKIKVETNNSTPFVLKGSNETYDA
jgi:hypothetical protein